MGGAGTWSVTLSLTVDAGTASHINAFSPDMATGGTVTSATINVTYGKQ